MVEGVIIGPQMTKVANSAKHLWEEINIFTIRSNNHVLGLLLLFVMVIGPI